ncbi:cation:dicarboxylase symporter family transporter [Deinococcus sp.]|uniref:cation:dicarboxylate symporter family transporter n=1 Tax=Deinococcus sp. TaxID=47478 RepID=UPI0025C5F3D7|nr:cation:dicarboxylase symporter family transporter [Deinococcus sp.]
MKRPSLAVQILIGLILGVLVGALFYGNPGVVGVLQPFGDIFIRLIKMIVVPIVLSTLIVGVAGVGDHKKLGKLGGATLIYFEVVTTGAILFGLLLANLFKPGAGVDMSALTKSDITKYTEGAHAATSHSFADTFVNIVPTNVVDAFARGDMLAIIFFAVFFGLGLGALGERGKPLLKLFQIIADTMFWVTNQIMKLAPIGVFALIAVTVSKFGIQSLIPLAKLVLVVYGAMLAFVFIILGAIARFAGTSILTLIQVLRDELTLAYSTASSESVMPRIMQKMEAFGCPRYVTSFVIPTGYSFNLDGSTLYQSIAAIFLAQLYGIHMPLEKQLLLTLTLMLTSKGIAGVPGVSFVVLLATLGTVGIPVEGLAFIAGIDRILDMARTAVNVTGNSLAAIVMSRFEGDFDDAKAQQYVADMKAGTLPPLATATDH